MAFVIFACFVAFMPLPSARRSGPSARRAGSEDPAY